MTTTNNTNSKQYQTMADISFSECNKEVPNFDVYDDKDLKETECSRWNVTAITDIDLNKEPVRLSVYVRNFFAGNNAKNMQNTIILQQAKLNDYNVQDSLLPKFDYAFNPEYKYLVGPKYFYESLKTTAPSNVTVLPQLVGTFQDLVIEVLPDYKFVAKTQNPKPSIESTEDNGKKSLISIDWEVKKLTPEEQAAYFKVYRTY